MEDELITFETAKLAKEKGFDIPCKNFYYTETFNTKKVRKTEELQKVHDKKYLAPTQSLLQKWLREVHKIHVENRHEGNDTFICRVSEGNNIGRSFVSKLSEQYGFTKVLEEGLLEGLKLIK